ncbi:acylneuraminate cytidylyltransferase family protein [Chlorobium phaeobacteroides]|uniref:Acylneuraminate cytidylyltransferase n=1 Tax=Chlorobium phaeobacteroides (strain DSM 266 / SMG 266 / 2430) TaxID=290317 RepID=A1BGK9_CHLPD|nr:acylneuraminate cytidylyltransferase family protein [Chlorobium phaeobacteroides]ABL65536.1 acylneuraminate cytidylyltransferase [Chlorobium phaeobacteroides DSM 266]
MHTVVVIPARGGSKGLKDKNIYPVAGKPLLAWSIMQARAAKQVEQVFVSTNDDTIAGVAREYGAEVIIRPEELSGDKATSESALLHALGVIEGDCGIRLRRMVFLQATSPLRKPDDIDLALNQFERDRADSLISVTKADDLTLWECRNKLWKSVNFDYRNRGMRQDRPSQFIENGSIYILNPDLLRTLGNRIGEKLTVYEMDFWQTWEVDTIDEIDLVEFYMFKKNLAKKSAV